MGEGHLEGSATVQGRVTFSTRVTTRNYLSSQHLWMARHSAERCTALERQLAGSAAPIHPEHRGLAVAAIMLAVAFMEGVINERYEDAHERGHRVQTLPEDTRRLLAEFWTEGERHVGTLEKYQLALLFKGADRFPRGAEPFQGAQSLILFRNALSHFKPDTHDNEAPNSLHRRLSGLFAKSTLLGDNDGSAWSVWALAAPAANWAVDTARSFADAWSDRMEVPRHYEVDLANMDRQFPRDS